MDEQEKVLVPLESHTMAECNLPEDLLFDIFARSPYPSIFRYRCLSKRWYSLLSDDFSHDGGKVFQDRVRARSAAWPSFSPLMIGPPGLLGYDADEDKWEQLPVRLGSQFDMVSLCREFLWRADARFSGSLICWTHLDYTGGCYGVSVANILTGKFVYLKAPEVELGILREKHQYLTFYSNTDGFIIVLTSAISLKYSDHDTVMLDVYEYRTGCWLRDYGEMRDWRERLMTMGTCPALVDGADVVMLARSNHSNHVVGIYNLNTRQWSFSEIDEAEVSPRLDLTVGSCGPRIILVGFSVHLAQLRCAYKMVVYEFNENTRRVVQLSGDYENVLPRTLYGASDVSSKCSFDRERIHVSYETEGYDESQLHTYDLNQGTWARLPGPVSDGELQREDGKLCPMIGILSPGLNPFLDPSAIHD